MKSAPLKKTAAALAMLGLAASFGLQAQGTGTTSGSTTGSTSGSTSGSTAGSTSGTPATGGGTAAGAAAKSAKISSADRTFIERAASGGMLEVELGNMAQQRGQSAQVKEYGAQMVKDHTKANEELKTIASAKGVQVPAKLASDHQKVMDRVSKANGAEFDREYMKHMVDDHKKTVAEFQKASKSKDTEIAGFATKTLPTLEQHLKQAQSGHDMVKNAKSGSTGSGSGTATKP
jgi:putative membrane protein